DLSSGKMTDEEASPDRLRRWIGGAGLGAAYLYDEVAPKTGWEDDDNRLIFTTGPLSGTRVSGTGTFNVATKGSMTGLAGLSQANGYLGAFLKFNGYDGVVVQGAADTWTYLVFRDGKPELRDASHLLGKDTWETEEAIRGEFGAGERQMSVFSVGPSGESRVRFAAIAGDRGHVAAHNGVGAVMGAKRLKAIAAARGPFQVPISDPSRLAELVGPLFEKAKVYGGGGVYSWGTGGSVSPAARAGWLPVRNYTTNEFPEHEQMNGQYLRTHFEHKPTPCWACRMACCHSMRVTEGPYTGYSGEEPEYEGMASLGSQIGITDPGAAVMLCNECDRAGLDINEAGWTIGLAMECYEKGLLTRSDLDGLDLTWGNAEAARTLLWRIARREGFGDILAEGVRLAAARIGGEAPNMGIYTLKGAAPRGHDHRGRWPELLDTCTSNTGTIEATFGGMQTDRIGLPPLRDGFSPEEVSTINALFNGWHQFEDCLGVCRFCFTDATLGVPTLNAITGWELTQEEAMTIGRRLVSFLRVFNFRHGLRPEQERPSPRYMSTPHDGPVKGVGISQHYDFMLQNYRKLMGWDPETGIPLPETLVKLGLDHLIGDLPA
ncbi:MAG: aldehyde ferredoxin oxidoreductase family protein, partial [Chloroflexota bacterium]